MINFSTSNYVPSLIQKNLENMVAPESKLPVLESKQPIKVDISPEARELNRKWVQEQNYISPEEQAMNEQMMIVLRAGGARVNNYVESRFDGAICEAYESAKENNSYIEIEDRAQAYFQTYAKMYDEIVQGYENGTREVYVCEGLEKGPDGAYRKLTKEEELDELEMTYKKKSEELEEFEEYDRNSRKQLTEQSKEWIKRPGLIGSMAAEYLKQEANRKPCVPIEDVSEKMLNASIAFKEQYDGTNLETLISNTKVL